MMDQLSFEIRRPNNIVSAMQGSESNIYCQPCRKCIFQVYFSLFQNQHLDDAEYLEYDLLDLEEFINPRDIYNDPPDIPLAFRIDISKLDLQRILYPMGSRYPVEA